MACDICGRGTCAAWMHSDGEQKRYAKVIEAFDKAREMREQVRAEADDEDEAAAEEREPCSACGSTDCNGECMGDGLMGG